MQKKFLKRTPDYVIGKGAKQKEIQRLQEEIEGLKLQQASIKAELDKERFILENIEARLEYLDLLERESEIQGARNRKTLLEKELDTVNLTLANPESQIATLENSINQATRERERLGEVIKAFNSDLSNLQSTLTSHARDFDLNLIDWIKMQEQPVNVGPSVLTLQNLNYTMELNEEGLLFRGIIKAADDVIAGLPKPASNSETVQKDLDKKEASLIGYADVDDTIVQLYTESKMQLETLQTLLAKHREEVQACEVKFNSAVNNLESALLKWQELVSKKFQAIMHGLQLDGKLEFAEDPKRHGEYELNLNVANIIGGSLDRIEDTRFSKGERLRVSIAFEMAILTQSKSSFFVWDEFDQNIGDIHREMLANVIAQFLPDRKLIAISPNNLIKGYVRIFPQFNTIWKNDDQCSQVSITRPAEETRKRGDLMDVIAEAKK